MRTRPLHKYAAALAGLAGLVALTGCGSDLHPGSAAVVGGQEITLSEADDFADAFCDLNEPILQQNDQRVAMAEVRALSLHLQVRDILAHDYAEEFGIEPGEEYRAAVNGLEDEAAEIGVAEEDLDTFVEFRTAEEYARSLFVAIGREELGGEVEPQAAYQAGAEVFAAWSEEQDVTLDPRFGTLDASLAYQPADSSLSTAVSPLAVLGTTVPDPNAQAPDTRYADSLPPSQTCG